MSVRLLDYKRICELCDELRLERPKENLLAEIEAKIRARRLEAKNKRDIAIACALLWKDLLLKQLVNEDKRIACCLLYELLKRTLALNGFSFDASIGELIYMSQRLLEESIDFKSLASWIYKRLAVRA